MKNTYNELENKHKLVATSEETKIGDDINYTGFGEVRHLVVAYQQVSEGEDEQNSRKTCVETRE